ncbi:hypothetical protein KIN20_032877 [Parelaphostrongylus tenuis]|uniref:G-patch domain-containing protein n=1 Tax=Parelaphostrongylus tenuis TaxID=148309 RepID=A0AAD5WIC3_PARTN|nr:hypothetical protein KIN20_032877 [Parelaphostrongylus tenuis]
MSQTAELMDASTSGLKSEPKMKISFGVKRTAPTKLQGCTSVIGDVSIDSDEEREHEKEAESNKKRKLTHLEDGTIPDNKTSKKKQAVVIPMVQEQDWRITKLLALEKEGKLTDEDRARLAILTENQPYLTSNISKSSEAITIQEEAKVVEDADYAAVAIEDFGLAVLRGCGWKEGEGIGRKPQVVPLRILPRRPNGLGLGATLQHPEAMGVKDGKDSDHIEEVIKKDSLIRIAAGRHKGLYGKVESRDDDNNSLFVRLAVGGQHVKVSLFAVQLVSKKEYERDGKCINKEDYDKEREKIEKQNDRESDKLARSKGERINYEGYKDKYREQGQKYAKEVKETELWVRADLLVRFIHEDYKKGRYFKEKMRVVDVASRKDICLEDSQGKMHYGIRQSWLETVLPRSEKSSVMIVRGKHRGCRATIEKKDKRSCMVVARLLNSDEIITVDFDDVCQHQPKEDDDDF